MREAGKGCIGAGEGEISGVGKGAISSLLGGGQEGGKRAKRDKKIVSRWGIKQCDLRVNFGGKVRFCFCSFAQQLREIPRMSPRKYYIFNNHHDREQTRFI